MPKGKKRKRRLKKRTLIQRMNKGYITFVLIGIALFAFLLATGFINTVNPPYDGTKYILVTPTPDPIHETLQLKTLAFISIKPTAAPSITVPADCGNGINSLLQQKGIKREPENVYAYIPAPGQSAAAGGKVAFWYHDENAMTLGATNPPVMKIHPADSVFPTQPGIGIGDTTVKDPAGFFVFPSLYLLDLTTNPTGQPIDAVNAGNPRIPDAVYGTWKTYLDPNNPAANQQTLPAGADQFPAAGSIQCSSNDCAFGSEVVWNVNNLGLTPTHNYLAVFTVHDGDSDASRSDIGTACVTIQD